MLRAIQEAVFGGPVREALPARVRRAIANQEDSSERLIAWMQFAVVVVFSTLYAVTPKAFGEDVEFAPVPWVLGLYLAFCLARLLALKRGAAPTWFLTLAVVADTALLMLLIWSFHMQYMQPAAFYLKAPTLLYVFIFIALRTLRFDPAYVLLAGASAAIGWLVLVAYAVWLGGKAMITRDFTEYVIGNKILLGAEFDKVITIVMTTLILALAIVRARRLLIRSIAEETAVGDLSRFFAPEIVGQITSADRRIQPGQGELRQAAILHCDIRGFTPRAMAMPPNTAMALLVEYQSRVVPVIQRHGGSIDKFIGDGILATFGAAVPTETYARNAVATAEALIQVFADWSRARTEAGEAPVDVRLAVAVGEVVFGAVGDRSRLEFTVIGHPVNMVVKLDEYTKGARVRAVAGADAFRLAEAQGHRPDGHWQPRDGETVPGGIGAADLVVWPL